MNILIQLAYLLASILFIVGIKMLGKTKDARRGNLYSALAMFVAILATLAQVEMISLVDIFICILIGSAIGAFIANRVEMTQMPEMVALFNGFGGLASLSVVFADYWLNTQIYSYSLDSITGTSVALGIFIGGITFTGSMIAFLKLNGRISGNAITFSGQHLLNLVLFLATIVFAVVGMLDQAEPMYLYILIGLSLLLGILTVIPIGGADMPVVISLLNSYSGMAACMTGFVLNNNVLIISGALVGASGIILTKIMCKAMNRSLVNVLLGGFGQTAVVKGGEEEQIVVREVGVEEAAMLFDSASSVIIVPGYGMAVAQAQHIMNELSEQCEKRNIDFRFAIHPVAGRMPGHMNVLLAEANISYDKMVEMDQINDDFANTDLVLVVGANDVVNPAARTNPNSPIYGMPILNADKARTVIVCKRSMGKGYAGIENELFGYPNCLMLFGDAKQTITKVVAELKEI
ncbi:MAG: NAD(P)(+) transhydrogenase (Re/Si-specific) subunit beta [Saprospiraceae bacterium]|jgi:NAD(P) transhydrogenase subunit beta|uniref:NAD(P)(+) transhydrogenase (Re/Si-specific) subunit beta n=1 Tax=Candidatus Brachybacter algidus TaxID=2982024 RepID=UPI001B5EC5F6|nr:NAD(P)(+) transhydrogenase (Re/Si-specific) subunit beta [Candidatus Brachybacter algidus]MBK6447441.1 NAD(P)(+) transhydrogenase (Re/Si-specific) subunit beta [Candidatus Brachybacter algidus]MBK7603278.1 NAD(P)(+) transhydrogenase (Re/Si-specific) subunit beta [Candidatus Brachybacter algidus]MBP6680640.1 NAD(P)(+) transhydrogenase (Re/Si-specific) subunit beta [Saprospiraceae bacterium]